MRSLFKKNSTVLFQGDSITDCGRIYEDSYSMGEGYAFKVADIYKQWYPDCGITFYNRGVSGNRIGDLLERYEKDIKQLHPDFISILVGINDTWRKYDNNDPTTIRQFEKSYERLLQWIREDLPETQIMIIEPYLLHTMEDKIIWHEDLDPKIQVIRKLAKQYADYYLPLDGIMQRYVVEEYTEAELSEDGVHPTQVGHGIIAKEYLKVITKY